MRRWKGKQPQPFTYYGVDVRGASPNATGIRYETWTIEGVGPLRADTKEGIKELIRWYVRDGKR